jgi:hypothetical protein
MNRPSFGEANLGALVATVVGSIGGLFGVGLVLAIRYHSLSAFVAVPKIALICWFIGGVTGWLLGGQVGPRLGMKYHSPRAEIIGGVLSGLVPVIAVVALCWWIENRG